MNFQIFNNHKEIIMKVRTVIYNLHNMPKPILRVVMKTLNIITADVKSKGGKLHIKNIKVSALYFYQKSNKISDVKILNLKFQSFDDVSHEILFHSNLIGSDHTFLMCNGLYYNQITIPIFNMNVDVKVATITKNDRSQNNTIKYNVFLNRTSGHGFNSSKRLYSYK